MNANGTKGMPRVLLMLAALVLGMLAATAASAQTLTNGGNDDGSIAVAGEVDTWTFTAAAGDFLILRAAQTSDVSGNFEPQIKLVSPTAVQLGLTAADLAAEIAISAPASGTYTVTISDGNLSHAGDSTNNTGGYRIHLAKSPGAFTTSAGDEGGDLVNGATLPGAIHVGDLDMWSFTAAAGDGIVLRVGEVTDAGNFEPFIRLYNPNGTQVGASAGDLAAEIATNATVTGTYTVVVADGNLSHSGDSYGNTGSYRIHLAHSPGAFVVSGGDEGGDLVNGATIPGTIHVGDLDVWSFTAAAGDGIVVRAGEVTDAGNFEPFIRLYNPDGTQVGASAGDLAAEIATNATVTGTYTVVVADGNLSHSGDSYGNTGTYRIHLAQSPEAFATSDGDEGGDLLNGATHSGTIHVGDLDLWSFSAEAGDAIVVRAGEVTDAGNFEPFIRLYNPNGTQVGASAGDLAAEIATNATVAGTYTVVVADGNLSHSGDSYGNTGTYRIHLAQSPEAFATSDGDEGGDLLNGATHSGTIHVGDLDLWSFSAEAGDAIVVRAGEVTDGGNFEPSIRLYNPDGTQVGATAGDVAAEIAVTATVDGTYHVVVGDWNLSHSGDSIGNTGTYRLHLAKVPGSFVVGDEGGVRVPAGTYNGTIHSGDLDMWSFCAGAGNALVVHVGELTDGGNFEPHVRLYGPDGTLLRTNATDTAANANVTAPSGGVYTVIVNDANLSHSGDSLGNTGTYNVTISGNAGCAFTCLAPPDDLVSWWPADGSAHDVIDGNDGSLQNEADFGPGKVGQGFSLDGIDDFVNVDPSASLDLVSEFTWDAWIAPSALAGPSTIMARETSDSHRVVFEVLPSGALCGRFDDAVNPGSVTCSAAAVVPTGQFTHVAMVLDDVSDELRLYANGVRVAHRSGVGNPASHAAALTIGKAQGEGHFFGGIIDEAAVFGRALSDAEVLAIFDAGPAGKCRGCLVPCDDGNPCTDDSCDQDSGQCVHGNNTHGCNDGSACTQTDTCQGGACVGGNPKICTASDACHQAGACDPGTGACSNPPAPNGTPCSDGNACTGPDACASGTCVGGPDTCNGCDSNDDCNDGNPCTDDFCQNPGTPSAACVHPNNTASCGDGVFCNGADTCGGGLCHHAGDPCSTGSACNTTCNEASDNCFDANGTSCPSDGNPCTDDRCNGAGACVHANNTLPCDDGNACTQTDACQSGVCVGASPVACPASDQCHDAGTCNPATGSCSNPAKPNGSACDDADECTSGDACQAGVCTGGASTCSDEDLAVVKMKVPKTIKLTESKPSSTKRVAIKIQNRGPEPVTIPDAAALAELVTLEIESLGAACGVPQATLVVGSPNSVPRTIASKKTVQVFYDVTFDCANDPLKNTASSPGHQDFRYTAVVHRGALDGVPDAHPADDVCPRAPLGTDPHPNGSIVDKGCGGPTGAGTFGAEVTTDVFWK